MFQLVVIASALQSCLHLPDSLEDAEFNITGINIIHADAMNGIKIPDLRTNGENGEKTKGHHEIVSKSMTVFMELLIKFHQFHSVAWLCLSIRLHEG